MRRRSNPHPHPQTLFFQPLIIFPLVPSFHASGSHKQTASQFAVNLQTRGPHPGSRSTPAPWPGPTSSRPGRRAAPEESRPASEMPEGFLDCGHSCTEMVSFRFFFPPLFTFERSRALINIGLDVKNRNRNRHKSPTFKRVQI